MSKPLTAAAGTGCYGNSSLSAASITSLSQDMSTRVEMTQTANSVKSRPRQPQPGSNQPGYMQMTRAASVRYTSASV